MTFVSLESYPEGFGCGTFGEALWSTLWEFGEALWMIDYDSDVDD